MRRMMYDTFVYRPAFSKNSTPGTILENLRFWCPKTPVTCGRKVVCYTAVFSVVTQ